MNGYLFELSKKDERRINAILMLVAFIFCFLLGMKILDRYTIEAAQDKAETESVSQNITNIATQNTKKTDEPAPSRYNIQLR